MKIRRYGDFLGYSIPSVSDCFHSPFQLNNATMFILRVDRLQISMSLILEYEVMATSFSGILPGSCCLKNSIYRVIRIKSPYSERKHDFIFNIFCMSTNDYYLS